MKSMRASCRAPHLLGLPQMPDLVARKKEKTGVQAVTDPVVDRRRDEHRVERKSCRRAREADLHRLQPVELLDLCGARKLARGLEDGRRPHAPEPEAAYPGQRSQGSSHEPSHEVATKACAHGQPA